MTPRTSVFASIVVLALWSLAACRVQRDQGPERALGKPAPVASSRKNALTVSSRTDAQSKLLEVRQHVHGAWTVSQILESEGPFIDPAQFYAGISLDEIRQASPLGEAGRVSSDGKLVFATQVFLVQKTGLNVLIDMGTGNDKERPQRPQWNHQKLPFLQTLQRLGVRAEDVRYVLFTHLHPDHVGFSTSLRDGHWVPTFPKARYIVSRVEWDHATSQPKASRAPCIDDSVLPVAEAGLVDFVASGDEVAGFRIHGSPAHTPGHLLYEIKGENVWFVGDLFHHPAQIARPDWKSGVFDFDPGLVGAERRKYFAIFAATKAIVFAGHTGHPYQITQDEAGRFAGRFWL